MERLTRPKRSAAERAKLLIAKGFGALEVENRGGEGLSPDEEDMLDDALDAGEAWDEGMESGQTDTGGGGDYVGTSASAKKFFSYDDNDVEPFLHAFNPKRPCGPNLIDGTCLRGETFTKAIDFFRLYFTQEVLEELCENTNTYAWLHILESPTYAKPDGSWSPVTVDEMKKLLGLIIMMGINNLHELARYWSVAPLCDGGWARRFLSRNRFKALMAFIHVSDPDTEDPSNKMCKLEPLLSHVKATSKRLLQPEREISIDERMVKSKGRSGIRQYMPLKPVRFGFKLWCICEAKSGYTLDFNVYTGKRERPGVHGLAYDVVMSLMEDYKQQGYKVFFDNFYTSVPLVKDLHASGVGVCGTTLSTRRGFPLELKDKVWQKTAKRGDVRYVRQGEVMSMQWLDTKPVYLCSTLHKGNSYVMVKRIVKDPNGIFRPIMVRKPTAVHEYNQGMCGVDRSDQLIQPYNVLLKSHRWWRTLFLHLIDVTVVNCHILFKKWSALHPDDPRLWRPAGFSQLAFREELVCQLAGILDNERAPIYTYVKKPTPHDVYHTSHIPRLSEKRHNCKICYLIDGKEHKTKWYCPHPSCQLHLCLTAERSCMELWHTAEFDNRREIILLNCRHKCL